MDRFRRSYCKLADLLQQPTGLAGREVSNLGTYINKVTFSLEWPENANIGSDECNAMFSLINAGCDGSVNLCLPLET